LAAALIEGIGHAMLSFSGSLKVFVAVWKPATCAKGSMVCTPW